jgi:endonuclease/exonuclease/phosphatase family metal-dependent hydrolase
VRVMTWNLWGRFGPWRERLEAITATLAAERPDVCGLQEVWSVGEENLAAELAQRLGMQWRWAMAARYSQEKDLCIGNAILSRWPILSDAELPLPVPDGEQGRVALHARLDTPGGVLPMFTTHFTHQPNASAVRVTQVRALAEFVAGHMADSAYPPVVTGDLNAEPDSDELRLLGGRLTAPAVPGGRVLIDLWRYADPADPGFTWSHTNGHHETRDLPDGRIDYILAGLPRHGHGELRDIRLAGNAPVAGMWPSDHFAVLADLT